MPSAYKNDLGQQILGLVQRFPDNRQLLAEIAHLLATSFDVDTCILIVNAKMDGVIWSSQPLQEAEGEIKQRLMTENWYGSLIEEEKPQVIAPSSSLLPEFPLLTGLAMMTFFRNDPNGLVFLGSQTRRQWSSTVIETLHSITDVIALVYHLQGVSTFSNQGNPIMPIMRQLYELMRQQLAQQRELNKFKDAIITAISDKARNPLASMQMAITLLKTSNLPDELKHRYVGILEDEWQQLNILINNIVMLKQLETGELKVNRQPLSIMLLIEQIATPLQEKWQKSRRKSLDFSLNPLDIPQTFYTDSQYLQTILEELLTNAGNYADPNTTITVTIKSDHSAQEESLIIIIENQGSLIGEDEKEEIFELFHRGKEAIARSIPGTGIGLALVKGLVELLEGQIQLTNQPEGGSHLTTITLTLPSLPPLTRG